MTNRSMLLSGVLALGAGSSALGSEWVIDNAHTTAEFTVRHMMVSNVRGQFQKVTGAVNLDDKDLTKSTIEISMDVDSIDTRDPKRDGHLKSPDFFDAAKNPKITFKSTKITKAGDKYHVTGDLTMHGIAKPVTFSVDVTAPVKGPQGSVARGVSATAKVSRKDWGLMWNVPLDNGGVLVGDEVQIDFATELNPKAPAAPAGK